MSSVKLKIKIFFKAIFHTLLGKTRLKAWILRAFSRDYELDSAKLAELIAKPLAKDTPKGDFIASLTSFPARVGILKYALHSIFSQDLRAKRVILVLSKDEFLDSALNSVLGMQFRTCENFGESTDSSLVLSPKFSQIQKPHRNHFRCDSAHSAESSEKIKSKKPFKSFCYFWLSPKVESPLPLNPNLQNRLPREQSSLAMTKNKDFAESTLDSALLDNLLPAETLAFKKFGLEIMWVKENLRQYNKIIPILRAFPRENIITLDDDIYYNPRTFSTLYNAHLSNKRTIWAHKARIVPFSAHKIADFFEWKIIRKRNKNSQNLPKFNIFLEGCGGVFYPPNCLYEDAMDSEKFLRLAPKADDIWLWAMALLKGTKIACVKPPLMGDGAAFTNSASNPALWHYNMNGGNDKQMRAMLEEYPQILRILAQEKAGEKMRKKAGEKS